MFPERYWVICLEAYSKTCNDFSIGFFCFSYDQCFAFYLGFYSISVFQREICVSTNFYGEIDKEFIVFFAF